VHAEEGSIRMPPPLAHDGARRLAAQLVAEPTDEAQRNAAQRLVDAQRRKFAPQRRQHLTRRERDALPRAEEGPTARPGIEPEGVTLGMEGGEQSSRVESVAKRMPQEPETHSLIL